MMRPSLIGAIAASGRITDEEPPVEVLWDSSRPPFNTIFSNGDKTANTINNDTHPVATLGRSTGKWYFEIRAGSFAAEYGMCGLVDITNSVDTAIAGLIYYSNGNIAGAASGLPWGSTDVIGFACDFDVSPCQVYITKNGEPSGSRGLASGITYSPAVGQNYGGGWNFPYTLRATVEDIEFAPPEGYLVWDGTEYVVPVIAVTFDPTTKGANATLSNGDLTVTGQQLNGSAFSTVGFTLAEKVYWEVTLQSTVPSGIGISKAGNASSSYPGSNSFAYGYYPDLGQVYYNGSVIASSGPTGADGDVFCFMFDGPTGTLSVRKADGSWFTMTTDLELDADTWYACVGGNTGAVSESTAHFSADDFLHAMPSGYTPIGG